MNTFGALNNEDLHHDKSFWERIKTSYRLAIEVYEQPLNSQWETLNVHRHNVHEALLKDDDSLAKMLKDPNNTDLYHGTDMGLSLNFRDLHSDQDYQNKLETSLTKQMLDFAECLGIRPVWWEKTNVPRPEIGDLNLLLSEFDEYFGVKLNYPSPFPGELGLITEHGLVGLKVPWSIYQAWRTLKLCQLVNGSRVLEIGPGIGRGAYYAFALGLTDYTTIDLPLGIVGQALFLGSVMSPDDIWMMGDDPELMDGRIKLLPPPLLEGYYDVVVNASSLPEMTVPQMKEYMAFSSTNAKVLYSLNHEVHKRVSEMARIFGMKEPSLRFICSINPGFVEEIFIF
jgi:hypothetical protein